MLIRFFGVSILALIPLTALAADAEQLSRGHGYLLYGAGRAPGGGGGMQQLGGGGEAFVYRGLSAGAELGYLFPSAGFSYGVGLLSVNGAYHLNRGGRSGLWPFVTGGYSLAFRSGHANLANFGAGFTWWMARHVGVRLEFRDYIWSTCGCGAQHSPQARIGLAFR